MLSKSVFRFIDIGANLTDPVFRGVYNGSKKHEDDFNDILNRSQEKGVEKIIVTAGQLKECHEALKLVGQHPSLYMTVGCHPTRCQEFDQSGDAHKYLDDLIQLANENKDKVVAVGECGLDFDRLHFCAKETQLKYFEQQFKIAEATNLPMFLHCRNSSHEFMDIVQRNRHKFTGGVVHSFDGSRQDVADFIALDLFIGINGCSLKTKENIEVMVTIPKERLLLETDAPWCEIKATHASHKHVTTRFEGRKKEKWQSGCCVKGRNEPANLVQVFEVVAACRGDDVHELAEAIYHNTQTLFFSHRDPAFVHKEK